MGFVAVNCAYPLFLSDAWKLSSDKAREIFACLERAAQNCFLLLLLRARFWVNTKHRYILFLNFSISENCREAVIYFTWPPVCMVGSAWLWVTPPPPWGGVVYGLLCCFQSPHPTA